MAKGKRIVVLLAIYATCVALASCLWKNQVLLTGCYVVISIVLFIRWHTASDVIFYAVAFVLGPVGEFFATFFKAWSYARPLYLIPVWLPFLWGIATLVVKHLSEILLARPEPPDNH